MNDHIKERSMAEHPSRRSFLGMSSVALATAALAGMTANAQEKSSTQKAEHDHSSSDPGPENKALLTRIRIPIPRRLPITGMWDLSGIRSIW
jgi:oxalate decarboxylase